jgi:hypothetical protein
VTRRKVTEEPAVDVLIGRRAHNAMAEVRAARKIAHDSGRMDDARDLGIVISTLASAAKRIDGRATRSRNVLRFREPANNGDGGDG